MVGHQVQIDERLAQLGHPSTFVGGYRVTDAMALRAAVESSGLTRMQVCHHVLDIFGYLFTPGSLCDFAK